MNLSICLSPCPCLCPFDWKTHWKEGRNHCDFVSLTPPLIGPEPKFDSPRQPVPLPVGHIREMTHRAKSEPGLDSAQEKHLQHKVTIQNTTSLQTSPSRQVQELTGPAYTPPDGFHGIERPSRLQLSCITRDAVRNLFSIPLCVGSCKMNRAAVSKALASPVSFTEVLVVPSTTKLCHDSCVLRVISRSSQDHLSLFSRDGEVDVPEFPAQRKSDQFVLVATVPP